MKLSNLFDRLRSRISALAHDLIMIPVAWFAAYLLRFNLGPIPEVYLSQAIAMLPAVFVIQGAAAVSFQVSRLTMHPTEIPTMSAAGLIHVKLSDRS